MISNTRNNFRRHTLVVGTLLGTIALLGCAGPSVPELERDANGGQVLYPDLEEGRPFPWADKTDPVELIGDNQIRIPFWTNLSETCERLDAKVVETTENITITLYTGYLRGYKELPCPTVIELAATGDSVVIETKDPVADREIIDGFADQ